MTRPKAIVGNIVLLGIAVALVYSTSWAQQPPAPPVAPPAGRGGPGGPGGPGGFGGNAGAFPRGGGGGRGGGGFANPYGFSGPLPGQAIYAANCLGCHGNDLTGGRAPTLFAEQWQADTKDSEIAKTILNGIPNTEMDGFKGKLDDDQVNELIKYIRSQSGVLKPRVNMVRDPNGTVLKTEKQTVKIETVAKGLDTPWGLCFLADGRMLVTERNFNNGTLRIIDKGVVSDPIKGTPETWAGQDSGMFDVIIHPKYAENGWIYLSYSSALPATLAPAAPVAPTPDPAAAPGAPGGRRGGRGRGGPQPATMTNIVRGRNKDGQWVDQEFIFKAPAELYTVQGAHYGSRFAFDKEGHLFYSLGERAVYANAQTLANPLGKVHRVNDDGSIPKDNPFVNTPNAVPSIWTYGNRNPQGLSWDPVTGKLWESEHGPTAGDEINVLKPGHNYGWGVATKGSQTGLTKTSEPGMDDPIVYYIPTLAPSGIAFYSGDKFPNWKNNLFVGGLAGEQLRRLVVNDETVTSQEVIFNQFGRIRDVVNGPDGYLYFLINQGNPGPGLVARLVPAQ